MSNDKLVIDLRRLKLTDKQRQALHNAIHKTVTKQLEKITDTAEDQSGSAAGMARGVLEAASALTMTANLHVTFFNVDPGNSELTAILNGNSKKITQSGKISFSNVKSGDMILIQVTSLGNTTITIDISADPMQLNFGPGNSNDLFFVN